MSGYEAIEKYKDKHRKLHASDVGANAPRECTNTPFIFIFGAVWVGMIIVCIVAAKNGDLSRLTSGTDYLGNVCGHGSPVGVTSDVKATWGNRKSLFFPVHWSLSTGFNIRDAIKFPMCMLSCEEPVVDGNALSTYASGKNPIGSGLTFNFHTKVRFGRCIPDFGSYNCNTTSNPDKCREDRNGVASDFARRLGLESTAMRSFAEVKSNWWVIVVSALLCVVIAFVWLFILRRLVKPVVVATLFLVLLALLCLGGAFYHRYTLAKDTPNSSSKDWYLAATIITWIAAFLYVCVGIYLWKDIMVACDIIEEASKIPIAMPTMVAVPPVLVLAIIPVAVFSVFMAALIYTSAHLDHEQAPVINDGSTPAPAGTTAPNTDTAETATFVGDHWRVWAQIFNVFVFLWTFGFIHAIGFMVISFCGVFWYWSRPGDDKDPQQGVLDALSLTARNHLGSLALGSMIIAIIQTIRVVILAFERHAREYIEKSDALKCLVCCLNCCLAYFDRFVQFINKNAYVVQCITGEGFVDAARHGLSLLMRNALSVGAVNIVGEFVMMLGKVLITALTVLFGYGILSAVADEDGSTSGMVVLLICIGVVAYFIACVFINVFGVCIDTVLISYCYDLEQNNGADKPYYCPDDLRKHVGRAEMRAKENDMQRAQKGHLQSRLE
eukprot:CAMPEP_0174835174 /NCGR_PEP_ID=MMETSP1114-20130205/5273_1 /TAXON_ID=312471 /ORGANISM="Neobodo designis, Strain CCAP 1951/1" /LENGTH=665 /DNA_ID=CAMNT_0016069119 /DNA_START=154 /DNA_END=2151 /DNA_ORIENTATION=+